MIQLPKRIADNIDRFTGRTWLLPKILEWWDKREDERLFLLTGGPGTGKSMILAWLAGHGPIPMTAEAQQQLEELRARVKAAHFCVADSGNTDPKEVARQIADHLTRTVPGFGKAVAATLADQVRIDSELKDVTVQQGGSATGVYIGHLNLQGLSEELSFNRVLRDPIKQLYADGYDQPMLLLFDALDEALTYSGATNVVQLLAKFSDLPPQVRILATTRDEPRVLKFFHMVKPFDLIKDATLDVDDVRTYAEARLVPLSAVELGTRKEFAHRLAQQAAGVFLYAAIVLDELLERPQSELPHLETYSLPDGLSGLYHNFLTRELGKDDQRWFDLYEPLLGLIAVAQGEGLTTQQLMELIGEDVRATLRASKQYLTGELPDGPFRPFHKSLADFLLKDPDNVDFHIDPITMHGRIAEYYWSRYHQDWSRCEGYGLKHLAIHLFHGQQSDRLDQLISPGWMQTRVKHSAYRYSGFVDDLMLAWQSAKDKACRQIEADDAAFAAFATCFRLVLIRTSITALSMNYPPELITRALETKVWSVERALDLCAHLGHTERRADLYLAVLKADQATLSDVHRHNTERAALVAAQTIKDKGNRAKALAAMAPHLTGALKTQVLNDAFEAAQAIGYGPSALAALEHLAPWLSDSQVEVAITAALTIADGWYRARVLAVLAPRLSEAQLELALTAAQTITSALNRAQLLAALAPRLSGTRRTEVFEEAFTIALTIANARDRANVLAVLAPRLSEAQLELALTTAQTISNGWNLAWVLAALAPRLSGTRRTEVLNEALTATQTIADEWGRTEVLAALAPQLSGAQLEVALTAAQTITAEYNRARLLAAFAPQLNGARQTEVLEEAFTTAPMIADGSGRAMALAALASKLSGTRRTEVLEEAFTAASTIADGWRRAMALAALASKLSGTRRTEVLKEVFMAAQTIVDSLKRAWVLAPLATEFSGTRQIEVLNEALMATQAIADKQHQAEVLTALVPQLNGTRQTEVLEETFTIAQTIADEWGRTEVLAALAPQLSGAQLEVALTAAQTITEEHNRARLLAALAPQLNGARQTEVLEEAFTTAQTIANGCDRVGVLTELAPRLSGAQLEETLTAVQTITEEHNRARLLVALAPRLTEAQAEVAHAAALTIADGWYRAWVLAALAPRLRGTRQTEVLEEARVTAQTIKDPKLMLEILHALQASLNKPDLLQEIRHSMLKWLEQELGDKTQHDMFLSIKTDVVHPPIVGSEAIAAIAQHIMEISEWRWV